MYLINQLQNQSAGERVPIHALKPYDATPNQPTDDDCTHPIPYAD